MLDLKFIRDNIDLVKKNCVDRNVRVDLDKFIELDTKRRDAIQSLEEARQKQNQTASAMKQKLSDDERKKLIEEGKNLKSRASELQASLDSCEKELGEISKQIPNLTHPDAPKASTEEGNKELRVVGKPRKLDFKALDHVELGTKLDILDFETAAKVTGQKFYYLKNEAVLLEFALIQYALNTLRKKGFIPFITPDLARSDILDGIGFNPRGEETQIYSVEKTDLCLIATAEITLGSYLSDKILEEKDLPIKYVGVSHCFRTEAGAAGKASKGLYRVHQFTKIEMFAFTTPESSAAMHEDILKYEEELFQGLEIPYRVVDVASGDLGGPAYRKFDIEAWMPGRGDSGEWGEVTSTSNCTDYQSRRLGVRYRKENEKKPQFVHMLNGTAIAVSRALIAILENHQQKDGSIEIPKALLPYMGGVKKIDKK
ncbi:MAG: serine--tRNA ligase [Pseudomonadota bacterium]